jgi:cellulose synthase/poly-beta-1,6-N-acetylglucosamine synthase-like glycosyltransferase
LHGWKALYLRDVVTPAELPVTFSAYQRQQHRWAKGSLECAGKLLPQVWQAPISLGQKLEATFHLTGYSIHLFMFVLMLMYPAVVYYAQQFPELLALYGIGVFFNLSALAPTMYFTLAQSELGSGWWRKLPAILFIMALGAGMVPNTVRAAWEGHLQSDNGLGLAGHPLPGSAARCRCSRRAAARSSHRAPPRRRLGPPRPGAP